MRYVDSRQWVGFEEQSEWPLVVAVFLAVSFVGLTLTNGTATAAIRRSASPEVQVTTRAHPVASVEHGSVARLPALPLAKARRSQPAAPVPTEEPFALGAELDMSIPASTAVQSRGLLAALLALEAEGDTTETSEGLDLIASPAAVRGQLIDAGLNAPSLETFESLPRMDAIRLLVASVDDRSTAE